MRMIDLRWTDLTAGYEAICRFQGSLENEFGRAVRVGQERKYRKEYAEWLKKRRIFFALATIAPLSVIGLCVSAFFFREVACVIIYWVLVVGVILVALVVAGRNYIREAINRPQPPRAGQIPVDLEPRWWATLVPQPLALQTKEGRVQANFLSQLGYSLPDEFLMVCAPPDPGGQEVFLVGPSGIWVFVASPWNGVVVKQEGTWRQMPRKSVKGKREEVVFETGPDDRFLARKKQILKAVRKHLPDLLREPQAPQNGEAVSEAGEDVVGLVGGGVIFIHPQVKLDKDRIQGNTAAYGRAGAWVERVRRSQPREGLARQVCLEIMELLAPLARLEQPGGAGTVSAKEKAGSLYQDAVRELRSYVEQMVN